MNNEIKKYLAKIGKRGGSASGECKIRGDASHYSELARKSAESRKRSAATSKGAKKSAGASKPDRTTSPRFTSRSLSTSVA